MKLPFRVRRRAVLRTACFGGTLVFLLAPVSGLRAQTSTWTGAVNGDWGTPGNWTVTPVFDGTDQLLLSTLKQPSQTLGTTRSIHTLTLSQGGFTVAGNSLSLYNAGAGIFSTGNNTVSSNLLPFVSSALHSNSGTLILGGVISTTNGAAPAPAPIFEGAGNITVSGSIQGGGFTMNGTGTLLLSGTNFFSDPMVVNSGTLKFASTAANSLNPSLLLNGGTFDLNGLNATVSYLNGGGSVLLGANTLTMTASGAFAAPVFSGTISGTGGVVLQISSTGVQTLSGNNTYQGGTTIKSGLVAYGADANFGALSGALTLDGGGLTFAKTATVGRPITVGTGGALFGAGVGVSASFVAINGNGPVTYGYNSFSAGQNVWLPQANQTYVGTTILANGSLPLTDNTQLGAAGNAVSALGGSLRLRGLTVAGRTLTVGYGESGASIPGGLVSETGNNVWTGPVVTSSSAQVGVAAGSTLTLSGSVSASSANTNYLGLNGDGDLLVSGPLSGTILSKGGSGTLTLSGNNASGGNLTVTQGTAILQGGNAVADGVGVYISPGATVRLAANEAVGSLSDNGLTGGTMDLGAYDLTLSGGAFSGTITGTGRVLMEGTGTLTLTGKNTFSGGLYVDRGTLYVTSDAGLGAANNPVVIRGGALRFFGDQAPAIAHTLTFTTPDVALNVDSGTFTLGQTLTNTGSLTKLGAGTLVLTGNNSYAGGTVLSEGTLSVAADAVLGAGSGGVALQGGTLQISGNAFHSTGRALTSGAGTSGFDVADANNTFTLGAITGQAGGLTKLGAGTLVLAGRTPLAIANAYGGTLRLGISNALAGNGTISVGAGSTFDLADFNQITSIANVSGLLSTGTGRLAVTSGINAYAPGGTISGQVVLTAGNVSIYSALNGNQPGGLTISATVDGGTIFTKTGPGLVTLTADNPFAGTVQVNAGTLRLPGSLLHLNSVTVAQGALLEVAGGHLATSGNVVNNGFLRLTGSATFAAGGTFTNSGVLDVSQFNGPLPANLVNGKGGVVLDAAGLRVTQIVRSASAVQITVNGLVGLSYQLQRATSLTLADWQNAGTYSTPQPATANGPFSLTDPYPLAGTQGFYRVVVSPTTGSSGH